MSVWLMMGGGWYADTGVDITQQIWNCCLSVCMSLCVASLWLSLFCIIPILQQIITWNRIFSDKLRAVKYGATIAVDRHLQICYETFAANDNLKIWYSHKNTELFFFHVSMYRYLKLEWLRLNFGQKFSLFWYKASLQARNPLFSSWRIFQWDFFLI